MLKKFIPVNDCKMFKLCMLLVMSVFLMIKVENWKTRIAPPSLATSNSELTNNSADYDGGAIAVGSGSVSISNSELTNNRADSGGAMYVNSGSVFISNSELTNQSISHMYG